MILITGATGTVGHETTRLAREAGYPVAAVTRNPAAELPEGARVVVADPSRPDSLAAALDGVEAILLAPRAVGDAAAALLRAAAERGTPRVVLLSAITVEYGGGYQRFADMFRELEQNVRDSGLPWTFLRCADFAANTLGWAPGIRAAGIVRGAYGDAATASIHERDIAEIALRALTDSAHEGRAYALTGPQALSQRDKAKLIGEAIGRDVTFSEIEPEEVRADLLARGVPADVPDRLLGYQRACLEQPGPTTAVVEQVLGRPALSFSQWAADHAAAFRN